MILTKLNKLSSVLFGFIILYSSHTLSHAGHVSDQPWHVCQDKNVNERCSYELNNKLYQGSCQVANKVLMCVRNKPIIDLTTQRSQSKVQEQNPKTRLKFNLSAG
ncbi:MULTISPECIES: hypothetical protein [Pseudoalteromonas]|uniref:hypothetical protein n=1 Tax=Pseudoalteromonas prydzensis TaxID=182141 RepID=UPI003F95D20A